MRKKKIAVKIGYAVTQYVMRAEKNGETLRYAITFSSDGYVLGRYIYRSGGNSSRLKIIGHYNKKNLTASIDHWRSKIQKDLYIPNPLWEQIE
jgi:hypothetical protein